jgi:RNA polymerase sigma factor (sigma-70 family)
MAAGQLYNFLRHLRCVLQREDGTDTLDADLLKRYVRHGDASAFEALVRRHGPMVLAVCRRVLCNTHDAEDAFQATFLVLVSKASTIGSPSTLGSWLYGVAYRTALHARQTTIKRRVKEAAMPPRPETSPDAWTELLPILDQEMERLPEKYRTVIVLCELQGKTRREAARLLRCAEGTVASRRARGLALLAKRLTRPDRSVTGGALVAALGETTAAANVPPSVLSATVKAASLLAAGHRAVTAVVSVKVAVLAEGVLKTMLWNKLKMAAMVLFVVAAFGVGASGLPHRTEAAGQTETEKLQPHRQQGDSGLPKKAARNSSGFWIDPHTGNEYFVAVEYLQPEQRRPGGSDQKQEDTESWKRSVEQAKADVEQAKADVAAAEARLLIRQEQLKRLTHIYEAATNAKAGPAALAEKVIVGAQISGRVAALRVNIGVAVHQGDVLICLDNHRAKLDLEKAQAKLKATEADARQADRKAAEAELKKAKAFFALQELRSPVDGTVKRVFKNLGRRIEAGEPLVEIEFRRTQIEKKR